MQVNHLPIICVTMRVCILGALLITLCHGEKEPATDGFRGNKNRYFAVGNFECKYLHILDAENLKAFQSAPSVSVVFYFKSPKEDVGDLEYFVQEYDQTAGYLNAYGLKLGLVDCDTLSADQFEQICGNVDNQHIYTYRNGAQVLVLERETMFDVNSIMSNILQLALLEEVIIVQSKKARQQLEAENAGQNNIVYSYHNAIGTYEHRVFMEIAYAYQDKYKFAVTTEFSSAMGLQDYQSAVTEHSVSGMWMLYCVEKYDVASGCHSVNYRGEFNLLALATYFKQLSWPKVVYSRDNPDQMVGHPCEEVEDGWCVHIQHSAQTKELVEQVVQSLQYDLHGVAGLIITNVSFSNKPDSTGDEFDPMLYIVQGKKNPVMLEETFDLDSVEYFISSSLFPVKGSNPSDPPSNSGSEQEESEEDYTDGPQELDDEVSILAMQRRGTLGKAPDVPALTDKTFAAAVIKEALLVVLFYLPFDPNGMLFLSSFQSVARQLAASGQAGSDHPLARVNCYDWTDVCEKENIHSYPVIYVYRAGGQRRMYRLPLDESKVLSAVRLLQADQPLRLSTEDEVERFLEGKLPPHASQMTDNFVLFKPTKAQQEMEDFQAVVKEFEMEMLFAVISPDIQTKILSEGGLLHQRLTDKYLPTETLAGPVNKDGMANFLHRSQFHLLPELTFLNFPKLYARKQPFAILFYDSTAQLAKTQEVAVIDTIRTEQLPDIIFCKMSVDSNPTAKVILANYTENPDTENLPLPTFAVVNHPKGEVHVFPEAELSHAKLLGWMREMQDHTLTPTKILSKGEWKPPGPHYDFLKMMDEERRKNRAPPHCQIAHSREEHESIEEEESGGPPEDYPTSLQEHQDSDIRSTLLALQRSRLYSKKHHKHHPHPHPAPSEAVSMKSPEPEKGEKVSTTAAKEAQKEGGKISAHQEL